MSPDHPGRGSCALEYLTRCGLTCYDLSMTTSPTPEFQRGDRVASMKLVSPNNLFGFATVVSVHSTGKGWEYQVQCEDNDPDNSGRILGSDLTRVLG